MSNLGKIMGGAAGLFVGAVTLSAGAYIASKGLDIMVKGGKKIAAGVGGILV
mgnify:CR=1 FL=1